MVEIRIGKEHQEEENTSWKWIMIVSAQGCEVESDCFIFTITGENTLNFGMMDACQSPPSFSSPQGASHYDELSMKESLIFSDSLKDLKDLSKQLYSAAEYFELSYNGQDHKQIVVNTLRDYATKAFINTVDHLGSMTYKVNCLLDDKIGEASAIELRFSCVQQRRRMCEMFMDHGGLSQQSLAIRTPKHHMRYILPVSKAKDGGDNKNLRYCMTNEVNGEISAAPESPDADNGTLMQETAFSNTISTILPNGPLFIRKYLVQKKSRKTHLPISISTHTFKFSGRQIHISKPF